MNPLNKEIRSDGTTPSANLTEESSEWVEGQNITTQFIGALGNQPSQTGEEGMQIPQVNILSIVLPSQEYVNNLLQAFSEAQKAMDVQKQSIESSAQMI